MISIRLHCTLCTRCGRSLQCVMESESSIGVLGCPSRLQAGPHPSTHAALRARNRTVSLDLSVAVQLDGPKGTGPDHGMHVCGYSVRELSAPVTWPSAPPGRSRSARHSTPAPRPSCAPPCSRSARGCRGSAARSYPPSARPARAATPRRCRARSGARAGARSGRDQIEIGADRARLYLRGQLDVDAHLLGHLVRVPPAIVVAVADRAVRHQAHLSQVGEISGDQAHLRK